MAETVETTALRAFKLFAKGWESGDFEPYIALLGEEMNFWFPTGVHRGKFSGVAGRKQMVAKCHDHTVAGDRLTLHPPQYVMSNGSSVIFEFESEGLYAGKPYRGHNAIAFEVREGKIIGFREYFGDLGE